MSYLPKILLCASLVLGLATSAISEPPKELTFVFQKQKKPAEVKKAADEVAKFLSEELGTKVKVQVPGNYSASVQALVSKKADFAYTSSLPFLLARRDGNASLILAEEREDAKGVSRTDYDSVFVVKKDSPLKSIDDVVKNAKNLRMVFTSPTSTSGYVFAYLRLVREGLLKPKQDPKSVFKSVSFGGSYTQALEQVLTGRGDVCAVSYYTVEGKKSFKYLKESELSQLRILARTNGVPTHVISARGGIDEEVKENVKKALLKLSKERPELLSDVYGTSKLIEVDEKKHVAGTVEAVEYLGLPIEDLT